MMAASFWGLVSFALALAALAVYLPLARRRQWFDEPNHRSSHERPTPGSGGIAVIAALCVALLLALAGRASQGIVGQAATIGGFLAALLLICVMGAVDDHRPLPTGVRLLASLAVSTALVLFLLSPVAAAAWACALVLAVALAWLIHLYNFMDGLDGFAALQCVLVTLAITALSQHRGAASGYTLLASTTAGAYLAFLCFNWPPAKLFMGDAGSLSAGLILGWLGLWGWREGWLEPAAWLILMSPFIVDASWTLTARALRGAVVTEAHREHAYQRLARHWASHRRVAQALLLTHLLWLQPLALLTTLFSDLALTFLTLGLFPQLLLMVTLRRLQ